MFRKELSWNVGLVVALALVLTLIVAHPGKAKTTFIQVSTTSDVIDDTDSECSLREAIISANSNPMVGTAGECELGSVNTTDVIVLQPGLVYDLSIAGIGEDLAATGDLDVLNNLAKVDIELIVDNAGIATIEGNDIDRIFHLHGGSLKVTGVSFLDGAVVGQGGNILNEGGSLELIDSTVTSGSASAGAGILNNDGSVYIRESSVSSNTATFNGGGLTSIGANAYVEIDETNFTNNISTGGSGGGLSATGGRVVLTNSTLFNVNIANNSGGAINLSDTATLSMTAVIFNSNLAFIGHGGAIYLQHQANTIDFHLTDGAFFNNDAHGNGGAIASTAGEFGISDSTFSDNSAVQDGGAIAAEFVYVEYGEFDDNDAAGNGGAIYAGLFVGEYTTFTGNTSLVDGGAVAGGLAAVQHSVLEDNHADVGLGGAVAVVNFVAFESEFIENTAIAGGAVYGTSTLIFYSRFYGNYAIASGGALNIQESLKVGFSHFELNETGFNGGAIFQEVNNVGSDHYIRSSVFLLNEAANDGGAIWTGSEPGLTLGNSTVSDNQADLGGAVFVEGNATFNAVHSTFWGNEAITFGGTMYKVGDIFMMNSIIAGSTPGNCISIATAFVSLGNNISDDATCDLNEPSDQENTDPLLAPLADNGGGTLTHALLPGSPALDNASNVGCTVEDVASLDQRGVWRPINVRCDIGAYESGSMIFLPIVQR
jgi:CSLREA domain-containing protein